jgi:hypothetical protein
MTNISLAFTRFTILTSSIDYHSHLPLLISQSTILTYPFTDAFLASFISVYCPFSHPSLSTITHFYSHPLLNPSFESISSPFLTSPLFTLLTISTRSTTPSIHPSRSYALRYDIRSSSPNPSRDRYRRLRNTSG